MPTTLLLLGLLAMGVCHGLLPLGRLASMPWNLGGILPLLAGIGLNLSADRAFHRAMTTVRPFERSSTLLTQGVFRCTRNPMYAGFILVLAGAALLLGSLSPCFVLLPVFLILDRFYVRREEELLAAVFGERWLDYRRRTRRWI